MSETVKKYTNGKITVLWKPEVCIHSKICWKGLGTVFSPSKRPWIHMDGAPSETIIEQVNKCPSGALSAFGNTTHELNDDGYDTVKETLIEVSLNGPLLVYGNVSVKDKEGHEVRKSKVTAFCRCGQSSNKPYCDGTHRKIGFEG